MRNARPRTVQQLGIIEQLQVRGRDVARRLRPLAVGRHGSAFEPHAHRGARALKRGTLLARPAAALRNRELRPPQLQRLTDGEPAARDDPWQQAIGRARRRGRGRAVRSRRSWLQRRRAPRRAQRPARQRDGRVGTARTDLDHVAVAYAERHERHGAARVGFASVGGEARLGSEAAQRARQPRRGPGVNAVLQRDRHAPRVRQRRCGVQGRRCAADGGGRELHEQVSHRDGAIEVALQDATAAVGADDDGRQHALRAPRDQIQIET